MNRIVLTTAVAMAALALAATDAPAQQRVALPEKDRALQLPMKTLFQVGELEGRDYENFGTVNDVAFDARGNLYVLDATGYRIIVFDPAGKYLRTIGRKGDGPGEFGLPMAMAILPGGELVVNDAAKSNLQIFGPDGTFRRTMVLPEALGRASGRMRLSPRGGVITETMQLQRLASNGQRTPPQRMQLPGRSVTRLDIRDSVNGSPLFSAAPRDVQLSAPRQAAGGTMHVSMSMRAFEPSLLWAPTADGGLAASNQAGYRITLLDAAGRTARFLERPITPRKVTDADKKRFLENQKKGIDSGPGGVVAFAASGVSGDHAAGVRNAPTTMRMSTMDIKESDVTWGDVIPMLAALGTDSFGRLWIQRTGSDLADGPIDVVDPALRYLGTLPQQAMPRAFGPGGLLAYLVKDDLDVPHVVVKQLLR